MPENKITISLFGTLAIQRESNEILLEERLGRQLSNLFALLICNHRQIMSKEMLIEIMWSESDNPANAMKFAIHRLRNTLKTIEGMDDVEWIVTAKNGYQFNPELQVGLDIEEFENLILEAKANNNLELYRQCLHLYRDHLLCNMDADWVILDRGYYRSIYFQAAELLAKEMLSQSCFEDTVEICKKGLAFDSFNEELIYSYLKALIANRQYNAALTYYEQISKRFYKEMGFDLQIKTRSLFDIISSGNSQNNKADVELFSTQLFEEKTIFGALFCDFSSFKSITQFEIRDCMRNNREKYILFLDVNGKSDLVSSSMNQLLQIIDISLRINDVYSRISVSQVAILVNLKKEAEAYLVIERILSRFYKKMSRKDIQIVYKIKNIMANQLFQDSDKV